MGGGAAAVHVPGAMLVVVQAQQVDVGRILDAHLRRQVTDLRIIERRRDRQASCRQRLGGEPRIRVSADTGTSCVEAWQLRQLASPRSATPCPARPARCRSWSWPAPAPAGRRSRARSRRTPRMECQRLEPVDVVRHVAEREVHEERFVLVVLLDPLRIVCEIRSGNTRHRVLNGGQELIAAVHATIGANIEVLHVRHRQTLSGGTTQLPEPVGLGVHNTLGG